MAGRCGLAGHAVNPSMGLDGAIHGANGPANPHRPASDKFRAAVGRCRPWSTHLSDIERNSGVRSQEYSRQIAEICRRRVGPVEGVSAMDGATEATWVRALCLRSTASQAPERPAAGGWAGPRRGFTPSPQADPPRHPTECRPLTLTLPWPLRVQGAALPAPIPIQTGKCGSQDKQTPCCLRHSGPHSCAGDGPPPVVETPEPCMSAAPTTAISRDPATGRQIASHPFATDAELETILDRGQVGFATGASRARNSAQTYCVRWPPYCAETVRSWPRWPLPKWARSKLKRWPKSRNVPCCATGTPTTARSSCATNRPRCPMTRPTCPTCRWAWCWASCRGISRTGR